MWRRTTIANVVTLSDTEVYEYSLPTTGVLNAIFLQLRATNGATSNLGNSLGQCINAIQVVDGGRILMDLTGEQAQMATLLATGATPRSVISEILSDVQTYQALLTFGFKLYDEDVGLDLSKLRAPRLRVDVDLTAVLATGATGFVSGTGRLSGMLIIADGDDAPSPERFLKSHEIKRWTTASSGDDVTSAPMDGPWARLIVRAFKTNNNPDAVLTNLKVTFDSGKNVVIDELTKWQGDAFALFMGYRPRFAFTAFAKDTDTYDMRHGGVDAVTGLALIDTNVACLAGWEAGVCTVNLNLLGAGSTQATEDTVYIEAVVNNPYMCLVYDFMKEGLLEVSPYSRGDIVVTQAVSAAAASLVLQQLMPNILVEG